MLVANIITETSKNAAMGIPIVRKWRLTHPRSGPEDPRNVADLDRFAFAAIMEVLKAVGTVANLRILELGPGDHLASGLSFLAAGAQSYTAVEPFPGDYGGVHARAWYDAVCRSWAERFPTLKWPASLEVKDFPALESVAVICSPVEHATGLGVYDIICSHYVGQHLADIQILAHTAVDHLSPCGVGVHKIWFGPQDCWVRHPDPHQFLRFSERIWRLMGSNRAVPNRRRFHEFVDAFRQGGLEVKVRDVMSFETKIVPASLAYQFRKMPLDSLQVKQATFVVAHRF